MEVHYVAQPTFSGLVLTVTRLVKEGWIPEGGPCWDSVNYIQLVTRIPRKRKYPTG